MSYNVFADMGFENPEEELQKARLVYALTKTIAEKGITHEEAANRIGIGASALCRLLDGLWDDCSTDDLSQFTNALSGSEQAKTLVLTT